MSEIEWLRMENARMRALLDERPAVNIVLISNYIAWSGKVYESDAAAAAAGQQDGAVH